MNIVILFVNIGDYHAARLNSAFDICQQMNWNLIAIQVTDDTLSHSWGNTLDVLKMPCKTLVSSSSLISYASADACYRYKAYSKACVSPLLDYLNSTQPSVVCIPGWSMIAARVAQRWCRRNKKISILMSESNEYDFSRRWLVEQYKSWLVRGYSAAMVGGQDHKRYLSKLGMNPAAIFFGYNIVDNNFFLNAPQKRLSAVDSNPYFLSVGRFISKKNLMMLLEAYTEYRKQANDGSVWDLVLCGDGSQRTEIETFISDNELQNFVHITGFLKSAELLPYFSAAKCFVHASREEQWGLVINEAMASGLPVLVSSCCGCFKDLVVEGANGFGFSPDNRKHLTALMLKMSSDEVDLDAMGKAALSQVQKFSPENFGKGMKQAIEYAVGK